VLLSSVEINNFRSLEHVNIKRLTEFNVFTGHNNVGKSSILRALQYLADRVFYQRPIRSDAEETLNLTIHDRNRELRYRLEFKPSAEDRQRFVQGLIEAGYPEPLAPRVLDSPFLRQVAYQFQATAGRPWDLHLSEVYTQAQDGNWARVLTARHRSESAPEEYLSVPWIERLGSSDDWSLSSRTFEEAVSPRAVPLVKWDRYQHPQDESTDIRLWLLPELEDYFANAFFFSPFRHSVDQAFAASTRALSPDGSNLPVVLNYLIGRDRARFRQIDEFINDAVPGLGVLHPGLLEGQGGSSPQQVAISFQAPDGFDVPLSDVGGGVEQLMMVATVLATVGTSAALFLEEPELHLHPGAQRFLTEQLRSRTRQVFLTTHSSVLISPPQPRSLYRVVARDGRSTVQPIIDRDDLNQLMEDIGARNSDLLFSDAVLFVEGWSDHDIILTLARAVGMNLDEHNVAVLPMGGGRDAGHHAPARSDVLSGISGKAPVPHMFVLDRDERSDAEVANLIRQLSDRLHVLERREIENYLLVARAVFVALRAKYEHNAVVIQRINASSPEEVQRLIDEVVDQQYGRVLLKRVRAEIGGLRDGWLHQDVLNEFTALVQKPELGKRLREAIFKRMNSTLADIDIEGVVDKERRELEAAWANADKRLVMAPGAEVLGAVFQQFGGTYDKRKDGPRIAEQLSADEVADELRGLLDSVLPDRLELANTRPEKPRA
jgi:putative ATP-dependent endonuclease of the OLD family